MRPAPRGPAGCSGSRDAHRSPTRIDVVERRPVAGAACRPSTPSWPGVAARSLTGLASARQPRRIQRPVIVVSSPRSGSSLLFETLARAPELYTDRRREPPAHRVDPRPRPRRARLGLQPPHRRRRHAAEVVAALHHHFAANARDRNGRPPAGRRSACWRRRRRTRCGCRSWPRCSPTPRSSTSTATPRDHQQHARRLAVGAVRHLPRPARLGPAAVVAPAHARAGATSSSEPLAEVVARQWVGPPPSSCSTTSRRSTPTAGASPATTGSSPTRRPRSPALRAPRPGVGRRPRRTPPGLPPHAGLAAPGQVAAQQPRSSSRCGTGCAPSRCAPTSVFADPPRIRPGHAGACTPTAARSPPSDRCRRPPAPTASARPSRCAACTPRAWPACSTSSAARCSCRPTSPAGSSSCGPTATASTPTSASFPSPMGMARDRRPAGPRHRARACGCTRTSPPSGTSSSPRAATTPATCRAPTTSPATSASTTSAFAGGELWIVNTRFSCLVHPRRRAQLRAPLAAAVHHRPGRRGPLPPQRPRA